MGGLSGQGHHVSWVLVSTFPAMEKARDARAAAPTAHAISYFVARHCSLHGFRAAGREGTAAATVVIIAVVL
jgi:hypothetical protein